MKVLDMLIDEGYFNTANNFQTTVQLLIILYAHISYNYCIYVTDFMLYKPIVKKYKIPFTFNRCKFAARVFIIEKYPPETFYNILL